MEATAQKTKFADYIRDVNVRSFDQTADPDDLSRTNDINRVGWCKVHRGVFYPGGHYDRVRLVKSGVCAYCDSWLDLWRRRDNAEVARINGQHYIISDSANKTKGMGGAKVTIKFFDGRVVSTDDLWHQGAIPEALKNIMPNNAKFARRIEVAVA